MPEHESGLGDVFGPDEALAHELAELGPLMRRQEQLEAEQPDLAFARDLRARLARADGAEPDPAFASALRDRLVRGGRGPRRPARPAPRRRALAWAGLAAAVLVAVIVVAIALIPPSGGAHRTPNQIAAGPPLPSASDLTRGFPPVPQCCGGGGGGAGPIGPEQSRLGQQTFDTGPYPGRVRISGAIPGRGPATVRAYRLQGPSFDAPRAAALARALGITAPVTRTIYGSARWVEAVDGARDPLRATLHSVAISALTGELVYHDERQCPSSSSQPRRLHPAGAAALARAWLTRLGWPGARMPVQSVQMYGPTLPAVVALGWAGAGPTTTPAALVSLNYCGRVDDAQAWPPIAPTPIAVPVRPLSTFKRALQEGAAPLAVTLDRAVIRPFAAGDGSGTVARVDVVHVVTASAAGALYLAPAYRLSGPARVSLHLVAQGSMPAATVAVAAHWYTLVPASR